MQCFKNIEDWNEKKKKSQVVMLHLKIDAMEESDEIMDNRNHEREEDLFDYDGISFDVGGPSCDAAPEDEWDPLNFY